MTKFISKNVVAAWVIAFLVGLYSTFVALNLWNWFAVPYLHLPNLSFLQLWGLMMLAGSLVRGNLRTSSRSEEGRWATLGEAIELCIPNEKQQDWKDYWKLEPHRVFFETVGTIIEALASNTLVLILGFILHIVTI
jgi:hypothetical protein